MPQITVHYPDSLPRHAAMQYAAVAVSGGIVEHITPEHGPYIVRLNGSECHIEPSGNRPGTNTGHGHVWPRPDKKQERCGGPELCRACAADAAKLGRVQESR